jgi:monofunctional biosynthetic peptidoglycan transglycosylase
VGRGIRLVIGAAAVWLLAIWPPPIWYGSHWPAETAFMEMREDQDRQYRPVPLDSISGNARKAVTIGEDDDFWNHGGIDWKAIRHALGYRRETFSWRSKRDRDTFIPLLLGAWTRRDALRGASTITQQLAKNLYLSPSRNPLRKVKEAVTAFRIEGALSKERILALYLNVVELGDGIWGFEAASQNYFKRSASRLSTDQGAALAATLPHPTTSNPGHKPGRMRWRQQLILRRMRGEDVEVPRVETEIPAPPSIDSVVPIIPDSVPPAPVIDSVPAGVSPDEPL